jgi:hypothetical protein
MCDCRSSDSWGCEDIVVSPQRAHGTVLPCDFVIIMVPGIAGS